MTIHGILSLLSENPVVIENFNNNFVADIPAGQYLYVLTNTTPTQMLWGYFGFVKIVDEKDLYKYRARGQSNTVNFGGGNYCVWSIQMQNVRIGVFLNPSREVLGARVENSTIENTISGNCTPAGTINYVYLYRDSEISKTDILVRFSPHPENYQKCDLELRGRFVGNKIHGTLTWRRTDQPAPLNYIVTMPVMLEY